MIPSITLFLGMCFPLLRLYFVLLVLWFLVIILAMPLRSFWSSIFKLTSN